MKSVTQPAENTFSYSGDINDIIASLDELLDSMKKNHSVLSKMADRWGKIPAWMKITGGLVISGLGLLISILTLNTLFIVTISIFTLLCTVVSLGLDNHYATNKCEYDKLRAKIISLGSLLVTIIDELKKTSVKLSTEVDRLANVVDKTKIELGSEVSKLKVEVDASKQNNEVLGRMVKCITSHCTEQREFQDSLDRHLNDFIAGKSDLFQALSSIHNLEKALQASQQRHEALLEKYEALVTQHEKKLDSSNQSEPSALESEIPLPDGRGSVALLQGIIQYPVVNKRLAFNKPDTSSRSPRPINCAL